MPPIKSFSRGSGSSGSPASGTTAANDIGEITPNSESFSIYKFRSPDTVIVVGLSIRIFTQGVPGTGDMVGRLHIEREDGTPLVPPLTVVDWASNPQVNPAVGEVLSSNVAPGSPYVGLSAGELVNVYWSDDEGAIGNGIRPGFQFLGLSFA